MAATFGLWCGEVLVETRMWTSQGVPTAIGQTGGDAALRPFEKLCATLLVEAIQAYVQGEVEAGWWLFEEGEGEGEKQSRLPLQEVCEVLDLNCEELRRRLKGMLKVTGLRKEAARAYVGQQIAKGGN